MSDLRCFGRRGRLALGLGVALLAATWMTPANAADAEPEPTEPDPIESQPSAEAADDDDVGFGRIAVGFAGTRFVPAALPAAVDPVVVRPDGTAVLSIQPDEVTVPLFGIRYWISDSVGLALSMGFNVESGSVETTSPNPDPTLTTVVETATPSTLAFAGRAALPLAVYGTDTYRFLAIPEIDLGYTSMTLERYAVSTAAEPLDLRMTGFAFGIGGRVGAEMNFGFIGVPQLAVQSAWGARFEARRRTGRIGDAEVVSNETGFGTSWYGDAFDIFFGSIGLHYYL